MRHLGQAILFAVLLCLCPVGESQSPPSGAPNKSADFSKLAYRMAAWGIPCDPPGGLQTITTVDVGVPVWGEYRVINECGPVVVESPAAICPFLYAYEEDGYSPELGELYQSMFVQSGKAVLLGVRTPLGDFWMIWGSNIVNDFSNPVPGCRGLPS